MGCDKASLVALLLLTLEGLLATGPARVHSATSGETRQKALTPDYYCDFDNADRPFCDWSPSPDSQNSKWQPAQGPKPGGSPGPPEGDIIRRDNYIHPEVGGFARLESPDLDPAGAEVCVRFLYYLYSIEGQLSVEIRNASGSVTPLWTRRGLQSSSWLSGAVTVPAQTPRPFKVVFKGKQISTEDIGVALDSIFLQPGPCSPCMTKCDFDTPLDFCGWRNPQDGDVFWDLWSGPPETPGVGPSDDFSRPGLGSFLLLDSFDQSSPGSSLLKSPRFSSPGCLRMSFFYTLHGVSDKAALKIYAAPPEGDLGVPLLTLEGEHGPKWRRGFVNYTGREDIQFVFEGVYAGTPGVAVDNVAVSPCEEIFASCDFNDNTDPFCGWSESVNDTWKRTNQNTPTEDTGPPGDYPHGEGYYIYVESGHLKPNESTRFSSSPFCMNQEACVEFYYHMHSIVEVDTHLRVLLEDPSGSAVLLWHQTGNQSPNWLYGSVTLPYTGAQPSKVTFEVFRGSNAYLDVSLDNILVQRGHCEAHPATTVPPRTISSAPVITRNESLSTTPVPPITTSTAVGPNVTVPSGTTTTSPITTTTAIHPNVTIPSGTTTTTPITTSTAIGPNVTVPSGITTTTPITTSTAIRPNITLPSGITTTTPITTSTAIHPNVTVPTGTTTTTPITTTTAIHSNVTVPTGTTTTTPITTTTAIHPNVTVPSGTTTTSPITTSTAIHPNVTVPTGTTTTTPITTTTAIHPNVTVPSGTTTTSPITTSTAIHPNVTVPTGTTTTTPITTTTAIHPNVTVPTGTTTTTPITTSTAIHPNVTIPSGTTTTSPITTSTAIRPNITLPSGITTTTPITTSTAIHPNVTVPTGTTTTIPITTTTASLPNVTVPSGTTTTTPITTTTAIHPNVTVPSGTTTTTPITTTTAIHPNITLPSGITTTTPIATTTAIHPNVTVPTGTTTTTPITTSTAIHPNVTVPTGTTTTIPITTTTASLPNVTVPSGTTTTTPITTTTAIHPNVTVPSGTTTTTPITTTTAIHPNITLPSGITTTTPIATTTAIHPNITLPSGITTTTPITTTTTIHPNATVPTVTTTTTPITTSTAIHPNVTVHTGTTTTTPITTTTAIHPNVTVPSGTTTTTPITTTTAIHPNVTVPSGTTTTTAITTCTVIHPNVTVPSGTTTTTPITTTTAIRPNITLPSGTTTTTPIITTTAIHPNVTVPNGTTPTTPITTTPAIHPNVTVPTGTTPTTPITTTPAIHPNVTVPTGTTSTPKPTSKRPDVDQTTPGQPPDSAPCIVSGDPHYTTYDGRLFHFMGNCTYLLTATCNATPGQPAFHIQTTNEHRGSNTKVSYLKSVDLTVYGTQIVLLKGRRVTVDGKRVTLPVSVAGGRVSVRLSGTFVRIQTDFNLTVRFDGNHHAEVSVPSSYFGKLCGLCGNFNGEAGDDDLMPDGTSAGADVNQLGQSWQMPNTGDASCTDSQDPDECHPDIAAEAEGTSSCGILKDPQGPFAPCHGKVPPEGAFESCLYDLCETGGEAGMLCSALQSYADRCAQAGVPIPWRNDTFCPLHCPPGSSYAPCGPACPATCLDPDAQDACPAWPCVEGCVCAQGSVLSGNQCVPRSQCGCTDADGHYHVVGDSWMGNPNCTQRCSCAANNHITCEEWSCTPVQECRPVEGLLGCQDTGMSTCHVAGDPHYYTFDGKMVSFMGTCTYTLVALCHPDPRLPLFNITAKNEERGQPEASYLRHVTVHLQGATITLQKSRRVLIDGQRVRVPVEGRIPGVSIVPRGIYVVIETNFGLMVKFDGNHHLEIQLPGTYFGKVCGMCGNFNNQIPDDYLMPDGHLAANDSQFGNSWKSPGDGDAGCQPDDRPDLNPSCSGQDLERLTALCQEIMTPKYQACHPLVDPNLFFRNCLYDMCQYQGMPSVLCDNIQTYVEACKSHGVTNISWRNSTFCPLSCPPNSHFSECASPCPATCANLQAPASCHYPTPCVEGCACDRGYVLSDFACVSMRECGCWDSQQEYHNSGDSWVTSGCRHRCTCLSGQIQCRPFGCQTGSQCSTSNQGLHYCRPSSFHQCVILGDPHYRTFDNFVHHFQGRCTYTLTRTLGRLPEGLEPLSVSGRNHRRSVFHRVSFLREIYVDVLGFRITLMQKRKMAVNGVMVTPPYSPTEGLQISQRSQRLVVETTFGFSISYDGHSAAEIVLPSIYQQQVGGLCGNYDGRRNNEYVKPDGTVARTLNSFGNSWQVTVKRTELDGGRGDLSPARVRRQEPEEEPESGFEMDCTPEQLVLVNGTKACGALSDPAGPFSACHAVVSPFPFQESCVYDLCTLLNDTELLCEALEAYAQLCQEQKVALGPWRQEIGCAMQCPAHTSYQPCMTACPASCANLAAQSSCEAPCMEGCASAPGYVLSGLVSVPYNQCGCSNNGQYYEIGDTFTTEDCSQQCTCQSTEQFVCLLTGCGPGEICAVSNYVRGCFQDNACLSSPCQNEGTCQLTLGGFRCLCLEGYVGTLCEDAPLEGSTPAPPNTSAPSTTSTSAISIISTSTTSTISTSTTSTISTSTPRTTSTSTPRTTSTSATGATSTSQALPDVSKPTNAGDSQGPDLLAILLGVFIPLAVILLALIIFCVCRHRNHGYKTKLEEDRISIISTSGFIRL